MATAPACHDFVIVIPVADRPHHLRNCLHSLLELLHRFPYPGRVAALIADDSREPQNRQAHQEIAAACRGRGLDARYLGQEEQRACVAAAPDGLAAIVGDCRPGACFHKGASITRNIAYLALARSCAESDRTLFWFIDSDQSFRVNLETPEGTEHEAYAVDYLHRLDRIFATTPTRVLTGKVVGDPPVSPAVMAGNLLDDLTAFLADLAQRDPQGRCGFHPQRRPPVDDAAYHDMADLFGYRHSGQSYRYACALSGDHDHGDLFDHFAARLNRFFDGEHPTRRSFYRAEEGAPALTPARTIYTGNYLFDRRGLDYFIPFAALKLRMAGPVLGRLLRAELGERFVSANLPMLHRRTVEALGQAEFRAGVEHGERHIDLGDELERQYFGDVMLFSMERLTAAGYPGAVPGRAEIAAVLDRVEREMFDTYREKRRRIAATLERFEGLFKERSRWWWRAGERHAAALAEVERFIANLRHNFGADAAAWGRIAAADHRAARTEAMAAAIARYPRDRAAWRQALGR